MKETGKRKRFFKVALKLINDKGFKAMSMRMLAKELMCDPSNIYNYVKSKHDILEQLLFEISGQFHEGVTTIESSTDNPLEKLKAVIALHVRLTVENPYQVVLLVNEWKNLKPEKQEAFIDFRNAYEHKLQAIIGEGMEKGVLKEGNIELTMNCILSSIRWLYSWYNPTNPSMKEEELLLFITDFILKGVTKN
ncbi:MAG: TetR/AcrR family transcriptional regulator [Saprospiraceae bacterium]